MSSRVVEVELGEGAVALVRATELDGGGAQKVGWQDRFDFEGVRATLDALTRSLRCALDDAEPTRARVELGVELVIKSGKLTGLVVEGEGKGSLRVTLEWERKGEPAA
jgi:hypothetical protein